VTNYPLVFTPKLSLAQIGCLFSNSMVISSAKNLHLVTHRTHQCNDKEDKIK